MKGQMKRRVCVVALVAMFWTQVQAQSDAPAELRWENELDYSKLNAALDGEPVQALPAEAAVVKA